MESSRNDTTGSPGHLNMPDSLLLPEQDMAGPDYLPPLHPSVRDALLQKMSEHNSWEEDLLSLILPWRACMDLLKNPPHQMISLSQHILPWKKNCLSASTVFCLLSCNLNIEVSSKKPTSKDPGSQKVLLWLIWSNFFSLSFIIIC